MSDFGVLFLFLFLLLRQLQPNEKYTALISHRWSSEISRASCCQQLSDKRTMCAMCVPCVCHGARNPIGAVRGHLAHQLQ